MPLLSTHDLSIGYHRRTVWQHLNLQAQRGQMICVLGVNGCGKSTLFRTLAGLQPPLAGRVEIEGEDLGRMHEAQRSHLISVVLTDRLAVSSMSVHDLVALGRYPYSSWLGGLSAHDEEVVSRSLSLVHLEGFADRFSNRLSDGELQRAMIAKALAQETPLIFLDEPTAHLDLPNRMQIMLLLRRLSRQAQSAILISTHELDIALQTADVVWLMLPGDRVVCGTPRELIDSGVFQRAFASDSFTFNPAGSTFTITPSELADTSDR